MKSLGILISITAKASVTKRATLNWTILHHLTYFPFKKKGKIMGLVTYFGLNRPVFKWLLAACC